MINKVETTPYLGNQLRTQYTVDGLNINSCATASKTITATHDWILGILAEPQEAIIGCLDPLLDALTTFFLFNHKVLLLVAGAVAILAAVSVPALYNYVHFEAPIRNAIPSEGYAHMDDVPVTQTNHPYPIDDIMHNQEDDTITVTFRGGTHPVTFHETEFEHVETYSVNESFAFRCDESESGAYLVFYGYQGVTVKNDTAYLRLWHYDGTTQEYMPCVYPDVIIHSRGNVPQNMP